MNYTYQWVDQLDPSNCTIKRTDENGSVMFISTASSMPEYAEFLEWVAEGNEPLPIDSLDP